MRQALLSLDSLSTLYSLYSLYSLSLYLLSTLYSLLSLSLLSLLSLSLSLSLYSLLLSLNGSICGYVCVNPFTERSEAVGGLTPRWPVRVSADHAGNRGVMYWKTAMRF